MMAARGLLALLRLVDVLRPTLTAPGFAKLPALMVGWLCTTGKHAVTEALVVAGISGRADHEGFHRFFSRGAWDPDAWGRALLHLMMRLVPEKEPLRLVLDDTLAAHKGPQVFGLGTHLDAVRSTRLHRIFCFGHVWVVLAVLVRVPFSRRTWALPLLLRLYRTEKSCERSGEAHYKKTELAYEMLNLVLSWTDREIHLAADLAYCNSTVLSRLPERVVVFGAMREDATLTSLPEKRQRKRGRKRVRGEPMRSPARLAADGRTPWENAHAHLYGELRPVQFKTCIAQWYRVCGGRPLRVVVVRERTGSIGLRVFFSTRPNLWVFQILESYSQRWAIEVTFRDLKQLLGFADSSARKRQAVERVAPFVAYLYSFVVLWASFHPIARRLAVPPCRPWYSLKRDLSFEDLLRAARRAGQAARIADLLPGLDNLPNRSRSTISSRQRSFKFAA
jgi:hypothetical protein